MLKKILLATAALAIVGGAAFAENVVGNAPSPDQHNVQVADNNDGNGDNPPPPPPNDDHGGGWWGHHGHMGQPGMGGPGGPGMGGPGMGGPGMGMHPGMMAPREGFMLHLGKGINVAVACGDKESFRDCVTDAQPLIDAAKAAATAQAPAK